MKSIVVLYFLSLNLIGFAQDIYSPNAKSPYGRPNPDAPEQIKDFDPLIGKCQCSSTTRNADGSWAKTQSMTWEWKYIMNGMAVQDESILSDGSATGSIRQFIADSSRWYVHFYASKSPSPSLPTSEGGKNKNSEIVLYRPQKAPNGMEGLYRITFYDITEKGYRWKGEWVDKDENIVYPTWKIECKRPSSEQSDKAQIAEKSKMFSKAYMAGDVSSLVSLYTHDGKIFPDTKMILSGHEALSNYWSLPPGTKILHHKTTAEDLIIENDTAYDYGYYEGKTQSKDLKEVDWKGKYVIIWKKINGTWKIYLDIWNSVRS